MAGKGGKRKTSFKPGQSGNPNGRPPVPADLRDAQRVSRLDFDRMLHHQVTLTLDEVTALIKASGTTKVLEGIVARTLVKAFNEGDHRRLEFILDRLIGKAKDMDPLPMDPDLLAIGNGKKTFTEFCQKAGYPAPFPKQQDMRAFGFDDIDPRILLGARGYGKTDYVTILGVAYDVYLHGIDTSNLIVTKSKARNAAIIEEIANALDSNGVKLAKRNQTRIRVEGLIGKDDSVEVITIKTSMRGRHPKRVIMDDPVTEEDVSPAMRKTVKRKYDEAYKLCKNVIVIGQPAHADDLYAELRPILKKLEVPHGTIPELDADLLAMEKAGVDKISIEMSYHLRVPVEGSMPFANIKWLDAYPNGESVAFMDPSDGGNYTALTVLRGLMDGVAVFGKAWKRPWYHCVDEMLVVLKQRGVKRLCFETNKHGNQPIDQLHALLAPHQIGVVGKYSDSNKHAAIMAAGSYANLIHLSRESDKAYTDQVIKYEWGADFDDAPDSLARCLEWIGFIKGKPRGLR